MLNKVLLIGNLTRDVELKYTAGGLAIAKIGLATNRRWRDKSTGEDKEEAMFIDVNLFGRTAEIANQYLSKGKRVFVEGRLVLERWNDQNGQPRSKHTVTADTLNFVDSKSSSDQGGDYSHDEAEYSAPKPAPKQAPKPMPQIDIDNEDIPF